MRDVVSSVLILAGVGLFVIAAVGLQRFADVLCRMHVATKPATLGLALVLAGTAVQMESVGDMAKLALIGVLQLLTAPVGAHMVGRAVDRSRDELGPDALDDLGANGAVTADHAGPDRRAAP